MPPRSDRRAYVCLHVFENTHPIKLVARDEDGWCFLCGDMHPDTAESYRVVGAGHLFDRDKSLKEIENLEKNWEAEREEVGGRWIITPTAMN